MAGGYLEVVRTLLAHGVLINEKDHNGFTPLHKACFRGSMEAVRILLDHGHPIDERGKYEQTPLHLACEGRNAAVVALLLENGHPVNVKDFFSLTPLHMACDKGNVEMVKMLLAHGAHADEKDERDRTPLHKACNRGNVDIVKILLEHGAQADGRSGQRYQAPLHRACGSLELVKFLIEIGVSVIEKDRYGQMPLHAACMWGDVEVVKTLLEHGAPVNAVADQICLTPLHRACEAGKVDIIQVLLENGAYVDALDAEKDTALNSSMGFVPPEVISVLLDYNAGAHVMCRCYRCKKHCTIMACHYSLQRQERRLPVVYAYERHFIKCKTAGVHIEGCSLADPPMCHVDWSQPERDSFRLECLAELEAMKKEKVDNTNVSYFSVLRQNLSALRNYRIMNIFTPEHLREAFPIYGNMIYCSYLNLPTRSSLMDQCSSFLDLSDLPHLPQECVLEVLEFLSNKDIMRITEACKPHFPEPSNLQKKCEKRSRCVVS